MAVGLSHFVQYASVAPKSAIPISMSLFALSRCLSQRIRDPVRLRGLGFADPSDHVCCAVHAWSVILASEFSTHLLVKSLVIIDLIVCYCFLCNSIEFDWVPLFILNPSSRHRSLVPSDMSPCSSGLFFELTQLQPSPLQVVAGT